MTVAERLVACWRVLFGGASTGNGIKVRRVVARIDIRMSGNSVQTDMEVTVPVLEDLANGIGMTLVPMPSRERH